MRESIEFEDDFGDVQEEEIDPSFSETEAIVHSTTDARDLELSETRYQKLIKLGAKARECCVSEGAFIALRIFLRGK